MGGAEGEENNEENSIPSGNLLSYILSLASRINGLWLSARIKTCTVVLISKWHDSISKQRETHVDQSYILSSL